MILQELLTLNEVNQKIMSKPNASKEYEMGYIKNQLAMQKMTMKTLKGYLRSAKTEETKKKHQKSIDDLQVYIDKNIKLLAKAEGKI